MPNKKMMERMYGGWRGGEPFTQCGNGSLPGATLHIRQWIPNLVKGLRIRTISDVGAGDLKWSEGIDWAMLGVEYMAYDLVPRVSSVKRLDITSQFVPRCDLVICRMVLNHLVFGDDYSLVDDALANIDYSTNLLLATQFYGKEDVRNSDQFCRLDLTKRLGEPISECRDGNEADCYLSLWSFDFDE